MAPKPKRGEASSSAGPSKKSKGQASNPSSNQPPRPHTIVFRDDDMERWYNSLSSRRIKPTKFYCQDTCVSLGIDRDVRGILQNLGWDSFASHHPLTYRTLTLEFLSSLTLHFPNPYSTEGEIRFRMFNQNKRMTLTELNTAFGGNPTNTMMFPEREIWTGYAQNEWWERITDGTTPYISRTSRASEVLHPALRYVHRLIVYALFSREERRQIKWPELFLLWKGTDGANIPNPNVNFGYLLVQRFHEIKLGANVSGDIICGGMISRIAEFKNFGEKMAQEPDVVDPCPFLNPAELKAAHFLRIIQQGFRQTFVYLVRDLPYCTLPNSCITEIQDDVDNPWYVARREVSETYLLPRDRGIGQATMPRVPRDSPPPQRSNEPDPGPSSSSSSQVFNMSEMMGVLTNIRDDNRTYAQTMQNFRTDFNAFRGEVREMRDDFNTLNVNMGRLSDDVDMMTRIAWQNHLAMAEQNPNLRYSNHPSFPPQFDPNQPWRR